MPIQKIDHVAGIIETKCAVCAKVRELDIAGLQLGDSDGANDNPDAIRLPACACGAVEFLIRTWDQTPEAHHGSPHDLNRRHVNALAVHLKDAGRSHPRVKKVHAAEKKKPHDLPRQS